MAAIACSVVTSYDGFTGGQPQKPARCLGLRPDPPSGPDGDNGKRYFGALSYLNFLPEPDKNGVTGIDLDGLCTCPEKRPCTNAQNPQDPQCDEPKNASSVDNAAGKALANIFDNAVTDDPPGYGVGVKLYGWNGGTEDANVQVELYNVVNVTGADGSPATKDNGPYQITVSSDSVVDPKSNLNAQVHSKDAYVTGGKLVALFDNFNLRVKAKNPARGADFEAVVDAPLRNLYLFGAIDTKATGGLRMPDAFLAGRMMQGEVFTAISHYGLCQNFPGFDASTGIAATFCGALDMPSGLPNEPSRCEALSVAIKIHVQPGTQVQTTLPPLSTTTPCGQEPAFSCFGN